MTITLPIWLGPLLLALVPFVIPSDGSWWDIRGLMVALVFWPAAIVWALCLWLIP